jgi:hypothetical protein
LQEKGALDKDEGNVKRSLCTQVPVGFDGPGIDVFSKLERAESIEQIQASLVEVAFQAAVECRSSRKLTTEAARYRRWCPQTQVPKPLEGTLIAISSGPTTPLLVLGKLLA